MTINTVNLVYEQQLLDEESRRRQRSRKHYPSSACAVVSGKFVGHCRRATWFEWVGADRTDPPDAPALFKMRVGDMIHEHLSESLTRALVRQGWEVESSPGEGDEVPFEWTAQGLKFPFSGRIDKRFVRDGHRMACEWKSTYGRGSDDVKANGPKEDALLQCACYLEQDVLPVDEILLMYAARDTGLLQGFSVTKEPDGLLCESMNSTKVIKSRVTFGAILEATSSLESFLDNEAAPPSMDYGSGNPDRSTAWRCSYCSYAKVCGSMS